MLNNRSVFFIKGDDDFPPVEESLSDGLLAIGGSLSEKRLIKAYSGGIFPWYDEWSPVLWYSPVNRCIFKPGSFRTSHSLRQKIRKGHFTFSMDKDFARVINLCATISRNSENGTWILPEMISAYTGLHQSGYAHSVEVWHEGQLAGGLYGVSLGRAFFGESMFHQVTDASKAAMHYLCNRLFDQNFHFIDAQMETAHLLSMGASMVTRAEYMVMLNDAIKFTTLRKSWQKPWKT